MVSFLKVTVLQVARFLLANVSNDLNLQPHHRLDWEIDKPQII